MSLFPKAKPGAGPKLPRQPRDWRRYTHVCVSAGQVDWDDVPICGECGMRGDHRIHNLNETVALEAAEIDARRLGEGGQ